MKIEHPHLGNYYILHEGVNQYAIMRKKEIDLNKSIQPKDELLIKMKNIEDAIRYLIEKILLDIPETTANLNAYLAYREKLAESLTYRPELKMPQGEENKETKEPENLEDGNIREEVSPSHIESEGKL